ADACDGGATAAEQQPALVDRVLIGEPLLDEGARDGRPALDEQATDAAGEQIGDDSVEAAAARDDRAPRALQHFRLRRYRASAEDDRDRLMRQKLAAVAPGRE